MPNHQSWDDPESPHYYEQPGRVINLPVLIKPTQIVGGLPGQKGKYDDVAVDHSLLLRGHGYPEIMNDHGPIVPCSVCGKGADLRQDQNTHWPRIPARCRYCARSEARAEARAQTLDTPIGQTPKVTTHTR